MTSTTSTAASARVCQTPSIARLMNWLSSEPTSIVMPSGSVERTCSAIARDGIGHGQRIRAGLADDAEAHGRVAVQPEGGIGILGALLDPGDVAEADEIAVGAAADDQSAELLRRGEGPLDAEGDVLLRFQPAGGELDILAAQGVARHLPGSGRTPRVAPAAAISAWTAGRRRRRRPGRRRRSR